MPVCGEPERDMEKRESLKKMRRAYHTHSNKEHTLKIFDLQLQTISQ
jgi:hypothetical protein